jgi:hypothetical protein
LGQIELNGIYSGKPPAISWTRIRFVRYLNTFLLGVKGTKLVALDIKKKVEYFLKSNLHLELFSNTGNLINTAISAIS